MRQRIVHLLEFHNREAKPQWWASFERQDKFEDELIDDTECLGGLMMIGKPEAEKRSQIYSYRFPAQEYKMKPGDKPFNIATMESVGTIVELNEDSCTIRIKRGNAQGELPSTLNLGPPPPIATKVIRSAVYRVAESIAAGKNDYSAVIDVLNIAVPRIKGKMPGDSIIGNGDLLAETIKAIAALDNSYLFIQGPPGAGKTYTSAHVIIALLRMGKRVGVTANSHKAIHNLLDRVESVAAEESFTFRGAKKSSASNAESYYDGQNIHSVDKNDGITPATQFMAGTAWLFADEQFDQQLDYLIIEEAGQVSVANVVGMGAAAKNIIMVGDQMQLGQPIQGVHPGEAGKSILEFLLGDYATIPPDRGIFLHNTRRLHPLICKFISSAFYEGRLEADAGNSQRHLIFDQPVKGIASDGIYMLPVNHSGCSQKSTEEGAVIKQCYEALLRQKFHDKDGTVRALGLDDILVVSPYNVQVNHLRGILPPGAKVGTVDKFQGQEAPVVLVSMVTSSAEDLPRNIEFLYSKNRLNVAISRAQCLAVVVANPKLLEIPCGNIAQMKLVNTFCWLDDYATQPKTGDAT